MLGTVPLRHNWFRKASFVVACGLAVLALVRAGYGPPPSVTVGELDQYIEDKVEGIRDSMHDAVDDLHEWMDKEHSNFVPEVSALPPASARLSPTHMRACVRGSCMWKTCACGAASHACLRRRAHRTPPHHDPTLPLR